MRVSGRFSLYDQGWLGATLVRLAVLPLTGGATLLLAHYVIRDRGVATYAVVTLISSLILLVPFADLGTGASVATVLSASRNPGQDEEVRRTILGAVRLLTAVGGGFVLIATVGYVCGLWSLLHLGEASQGSAVELAMAVVVAVYGLNLPLSLWTRVYIGLGRNARVVALNGLAPIIALALTLAFLQQGAPLWCLVSAMFIAQMVVSLMGWVWLAGSSSVDVRWVVRRLFAFRTVRGANLARAALPMFAISVAQPIALQSDRLMLNWRNTVDAVAQYSLGAQVYLALLSVLTAGTIGLWPVFVRRRRDEKPGSSQLVRVTLGVGVATLLLAGLLLGVATPLAAWASGGKAAVSGTLALSFAILLIVQGLTLPMGIYLNDVAGLRFQARLLGLMLPVNLFASYLSAPLGGQGPLLSSAASILLFQTVPCIARVRAEASALPSRHVQNPPSPELLDGLDMSRREG